LIKAYVEKGGSVFADKSLVASLPLARVTVAGGLVGGGFFDIVFFVFIFMFGLASLMGVVVGG
jgi:hypothetical protein